MIQERDAAIQERDAAIQENQKLKVWRAEHEGINESLGVVHTFGFLAGCPRVEQGALARLRLPPRESNQRKGMGTSPGDPWGRRTQKLNNSECVSAIPSRSALRQAKNETLTEKKKRMGSSSDLLELDELGRARYP